MCSPSFKQRGLAALCIAGLVAALYGLAGCAFEGRRPSPPPPPPPPPQQEPGPGPVADQDGDGVPDPGEPGRPPQAVVVPDLETMAIYEAIDRLEALGFEVDVQEVWDDQLAEIYGESYEDWPEPETVIRQNPPPGTRVPPGARITLDLALWGHEAAIEPGDRSEPEPDVGVPTGGSGAVAGAGGGQVSGTPPTPGGLFRADTDRDGILDPEDGCPGTTPGAGVDAAGCSDRQIIERLPRGTYAFNAPDEMVVGKEPSYLVTLVLKPQAERVAGEQARAAVVTILEREGTGQAAEPIEVIERPFADQMSAELTGPGWKIEPRAGFKGKMVVSDETVWKWDVYPECPEPSLSLECGTAQLNLAVYAHFGDGRYPWPLLDEKIIVRITAARLAGDFLRNYWQWIIGTLLLPAIGWWVNKRRSRGGKKAPVRILFLASNPVDTQRLTLDQEVRAIDQAVQMAKYRDQFDLEQHWAVRSSEVDDLLLRHEPHIVHFSGHGSEASELMFEDPEGGGSRAVPPAELSRLFSTLKDNVRLVVLNACYSEAQASSIAQHIDCVVGMSRAVSDAAAIRFAETFYKTLAFGRSVKTAFDLACGEVEPDEASTPRLKANRADAATVIFAAEAGSDSAEA